MNGDHQKLTYIEKRILDFIPLGRESAITSDSLQVLFAMEGNDLNDVAVRNIIRNLIKNHHVPIASGGKGFYIIETDEEADRYEASLMSRVGKIVDRYKHFRMARQTWMKQQIDIFGHSHMKMEPEKLDV